MEPDRIASPGLDDVLLGDSAISLVGGGTGELVYRGFDISELLPTASYESVVYLLLYGDAPARDPPEPLTEDLVERRGLSRVLERLVESVPSDAPPIDALRTLTSALGGEGAGFPPTVGQGLDLVARSPTLLARFVRSAAGASPVAPRAELGHVANYLWMLSGSPADPRKVRALERYFVLLADHGMNPSTLALRVALSTGADLYAAATAALAALKGPAHGGATPRVLDMLDAVGDPGEADRWVRGALARRERLYGFGHRAYKVEDPRSAALKGIAREVADPRRFAVAEAVEGAGLAALKESKPGERLYPNVEFYAAVVLEAVGLARPLFTPTFALARTAGWAAHAIEQAARNRLMRPELRYVGPAKGRRWPAPDPE